MPCHNTKISALETDTIHVTLNDLFTLQLFNAVSIRVERSIRVETNPTQEVGWEISNEGRSVNTSGFIVFVLSVRGAIRSLQLSKTRLVWRTFSATRFIIVITNTSRSRAVKFHSTFRKRRRSIFSVFKVCKASEEAAMLAIEIATEVTRRGRDAQ